MGQEKIKLGDLELPFLVFGGDVCSDRDDGGGSGSAAAAAKASDTNHNGHQVFDRCPMRSTCS